MVALVLSAFALTDNSTIELSAFSAMPVTVYPSTLKVSVDILDDFMFSVKYIETVAVVSLATLPLTGATEKFEATTFATVLQ